MLRFVCRGFANPAAGTPLLLDWQIQQNQSEHILQNTTHQLQIFF